MPTLDEWLNKTRPVSAGNNLLAGSELNPDAAAEALKQARRNNLPPSLTGDTPDPGLALRNQMSDAADTLRSSPGLDKWIASQPYQVAGFVRDGLKDMGTMEALVNSFKRGVPALKSLLPSVDMSGAARDLNEIEQISARIASGVESEQDLLQYPLFNKVYAGLPVGERGRDQLLKAWTDYRTKAVPAAQERLARSTVEVARLQAQRAGIPLPAVAERVSRAETFGEGFRAIAQDPIKFIASVGPESLVQSAPSLLAAIPASIAGGPIGAGAAIGGGSFVTDYAASILDGLGSEGVNIQDPEAVRKALRDPALLGRIVDQATRRAAVVGAFDAVSGGLAGKTLLPKTVVARFGEKSLATELANIALQTPLQGALGAAGEALGQVAAGQEIRPGDVLAEAFGEFFGAPVEVVSASAGRLLARAEEGASAASTAQNNARLLGELQTLADASVVRQRDVETFEGFLQTVTQDTPVESLFIDAQTLIDSGLAEKLADQSPTVAEQLPQAQAGTMIRIPTAEVMGRFNQDLAVLLPEMRTDPNGMSQKEADEYVATRGDQLRAEVESVLSQSESDQAAQEARGRVRDTVAQELMATGRVTQDVADSYALLTSTFYHVMGRRMGMDAEQLFGQERLRVAGVGRGEFEQPRNIKSLLRKNGIPIASKIDADRLWSDNKRIYAFAEFDTTPVLVTSYEMLDSYSPDQLLYLPDEFLQTDIPPEAAQALDEEAGEAQEIRGSFSPADLTIRLTKAQDLSTFLHESGHFYLHMLVNLASRPDAPEDVRKDAETILNWFGIKSTPEMSQFDVWLNMSTDEQRPSHERFARGFEVYLAEGKAPSTELQPMFDRFRSWLLNVYRALMERAKAAMGKQVSFGKAMQAELNDEVRAVFDRMLATQEEIEAKEAAQSLGMMFKTEAEAQKFGIDWKAYQAQGEAATQQAITDLTAKSVQDMKWLENARSRLLSKLQREERETRRSVRSVVRPEIMSQPIYQAWTYLTGTLTDDPNAEPASRFDAEFVEQVTASKEVVAQLRRRGMVADYGDAKKGFAGEHPDVVAETFGFSSGYELIQAILAAPKPEEAINAETDARMLRDFSDLATEQGRNDAVNAALANDARARMVETELAALEKAMSPTAMIGGRRQRTLPGAARAFARSVINRLKIRDVRVGQFSASASRAAKNADAAVKRGNLAEAALEKRNQLVNNYAAKFAGEALDNVKSGLAYLKKFAREGTRKNIDVEYLDQIDRILERFDLRQKSLRDLDRRAALAKFIEDQRELGIEPDLPEHITNEAQAVNYKNLTVEEFAGLVDSVRQIEHFGRLKRKLLLAKDKREFAALMAEIRESVIANDRGRVADNQTRTDLGSILTRAFKTFTAAHRKMASIVYELDGFKDGGPLWDALIRTANERGNWEANKQAELTGRLAQLLKALPRKRENRFSKGIYFAKIGRSLNQEGRLSVALNWGNEGNRQRLMDGYGWTEEGVQQVLDSLTQGEWDFVQGVWDTFESLRPDIAKVERDLMGKEPEWVQAVPVQTQFGTYRGGYYPAIYDPAQSLRAEQMEAEEQAKRQLRGARTAATVRSNFVKGRAAEVKGRPLLLTMDATFNGLTDVVHYLAYKEWLIDANRILRAIDPTIRERYGSEMVSQLRTAVEAIAAGEATNPHALDKPLRHIRIGSMVAGLGFNLVNAIMQPLGLTQSIVRIGPRYVAQGVAEFAKNPVKLATTVLEKSVFMQNRKRTQNRELNDLRNNLRGQTETRQFIDAAMFLPMTAIQMTVDIPTWWGAYQKAQTEGFDEDTSIQIADQAVLASQGGGQAKDLAAIQRGGEFVKLFTVFYGFFNTAYNLGVERIRGTNPRSPSQIARLATDLFLIYSVPAVMGMFIKDAFKIGDEDDEEEIAKKLAAEQVSFLFGTMVGVREAAGAAQIALGLSTSGGLGYNGPAGLRLFNELNKFAQQANQGELDRALVRTGVNVAGIALHLPSAQINRTIDGVVAMSEGRTQNPVALIGGAPPQ